MPILAGFTFVEHRCFVPCEGRRIVFLTREPETRRYTTVAVINMGPSPNSNALPAFGRFGDSIRFVDYRDLYTRMQRIIPSLRLEVFGRRTEHRESFSLLHYLVHEASALRIPLPVTVTKRESPDFEMRLGDKSVIGVEVSEATTPEYQVWLKAQASRRAQYFNTPSSEGRPFLTGAVPSMESSGLVDSQEGIERWVETLVTCCRKKAESAAKYDYPHPLYLVLFSNTGDSIEDYDKAVQLLRARVSGIKPFERVFILVGNTILLRDVFGKYERHDAFVEFDETENALEYLDRVAQFLGDRVPYSNWKWIWIALYESLYAFMICALKGTAPDEVLEPIICPNDACGKTYLPGTVQDNAYRCPNCNTDFAKAFQEKLISFEEALRRVQRPEKMQRFIGSEPLVLREQEVQAIRKLKGLGEGFLQFVPRTWAIELREYEELVLKIVSIVEALVTFKHNIYLSEPEEERFGGILQEIKWLLGSPSSRDYVR